MEGYSRRRNLVVPQKLPSAIAFTNFFDQSLPSEVLLDRKGPFHLRFHFQFFGRLTNWGRCRNHEAALRDTKWARIATVAKTLRYSRKQNSALRS